MLEYREASTDALARATVYGDVSVQREHRRMSVAECAGGWSRRMHTDSWGRTPAGSGENAARGIRQTLEFKARVAWGVGRGATGSFCPRM